MSESLEVASLRVLAAHIGARVTSTTGGQHSSTSLHYAAGTLGSGLAVDLAELSGPSALTPGLKRIAVECARLVPGAAELIYAEGPCLRYGRPFQYGPITLRAHRNHVHLAVNRGFRFVAPAPPVTEVRPMYDPPFPIAGAVVASLNAPGGGAWVLTESGAVYAFGCPDHGAPNRHPEYWNIPGQKAARLEAHPSGGYVVIDNAGRHYDYPAS